MKAIPILSVLLVLPLAAGEMREAPTSAELAERLRAAGQADPMRNLQVIEDGDPSVAARPSDLVASSDFLCHNGVATLVPKGSLLAVPAHLKSRTIFQAGARIVNWEQFFNDNRDWISTTEVDLEQAAGRRALGESLTKDLAESRLVVVAVMQQGPISVNPHQPAASAAAE